MTKINLTLLGLAFATILTAPPMVFAQTNTYPWPSSGNVGIGTATPSYRLHVEGTSYYPVFYVHTNTAGNNVGSFLNDFAGGAIFGDGPNGNAFQAVNGSSAALLTVRSNGNVGIGTTNPSQKLYVDGTIAVPAGRQFRFEDIDGTYRGAIFHDGNNDDLRFFTRSDGASPRFVIQNSGNVGIGTTSPTEKLAVNGRIRAKEVIVETNWSDFVFDPGYRLTPLSEVERQIRAERHLPGIPSAQEVADGGVSLGDMQARLLQKVEELTLHVIAQEKRIQKLEEENRQLRSTR